MLKHGVEDEKELVHASHQSHLFGLARCAQTGVKGLDDRVIASSHQSGHVKGRSHGGPSTPNGAFTSEGATIAVERSDPYQSSDLLAVQGAQLRELCQEGKGQDWAHPGEGLYRSTANEATSSSVHSAATRA